MDDEYPSKGLLQSQALTQYIMNTSAYPREHHLLKQIRESTSQKYGPLSVQNVAVDEAQLISMILKLMKAKTTLEIGVFTGYSLLATALALPDDGHVTGIDMDREAYEVGVPHMKRAGVEEKINFIEKDAMSAIDEIIDERGESVFDFVFVDADKERYELYHEKVMKVVKVGGVVAYDNTLWYGSVAWEEERVPPILAVERKAILKFNEVLRSDPRIELSHVSIGDGVSLCRRLL